MCHHVCLGLGSNLGDRASLLEQAIQLVGERIGEVLCRSSFIETEPWGFVSTHHFLNGVILCETQLTPHEVFETAQQIERELGKQQEHTTQRNQGTTYQDRPIDIDILLYDDLTVDEPDLQIPHPLMNERDFVMKPLQEIETKLNKKLKLKKQ